MEGLVNRRALWIALLVLLLTLLSVSAEAKESNSSDDQEIENTDDSSSLIPKTQVKRNVAYWARAGHRKFFLPSRSSKRNVAWLARTGGRDTVLFPTNTKRLSGDVIDVDELDDDFEPYMGEDIEYLDEDSPYNLEKRNIASLVNSRTIPSFISDYKRHFDPTLGSYRGLSTGSYDQLYDRPNKRYFASLLKSETPPASMYSRMNRRFGYFGGPTKRFFSSLLENDYGAPGEDDAVDKRGLASLLKSDNPYKGKRSFASLLKSDSGIGMSGKRYYSSLLDDSKTEDKRFVASLLKSKALQDVDQGPSNRILGSIYDRQGLEMEKRHFSSLINRNSPYSNGKHITKRHVGSLRDTPKRFYGSLLDNARDPDPYDPFDKRSLGSLLKSSSYNHANKKNVGSALRYRQGKRGEEDAPLTEEELELDVLNKRFLGSLLDSTTNDKLYGHSPGKRHFGSLLDNRDVRSEVLFDEEAYPLEGNDDDKRHVSSVFDGRSAPDKRFLGSLMDSRNPYLANAEGKRFLGSAINSRMSFKNEGKRFLGSAINSRMNFKSDDDKRFAESVYDADSDVDADKRFVGSIVQSRDSNKNDEKRFFASVLDNTRKANNNGGSMGTEKRFLGSTLKSKSNDVRSKRSVSDDDDDNDEIEDRDTRSADYYEESLYEPSLQDVDEFAAGDPPLLKSPVKRFLPPMARKNWFPEFYYYGYNI